jgi:glycosyltransferase involved in cell wall biosynthesis
MRVMIQQPALPSYRVAVFRALAQRPGIDVSLACDEQPDLANVAPDGFSAAVEKSRQLRIAGRTLHWHGPQWRSASKRACDVLVLSWNINYLSLIPALIRARLSGVGTVLWGHGYGKADASWRAKPRDAVTRLADAVLFYDRANADAYIARGHDARRVFVATNALDDGPIRASREHWRSDHAAMEAFIREQGLIDCECVLFVSRLVPKARFELLLQAVAKLAPSRPRLRLLAVGGGDLPRYKQIAGELGLDSLVRFAGPVYGEAQLGAYFVASRVFVYPAGIGLSLIHALGYGVPVITSDDMSPHGPEIIALKPEHNGLLYRDGDADDLARQIAAVLDDPARQRAMSEAAIDTIERGYRLEHMVNGMEAAIRYAAAKHPSR